jgi:hypothetical protein
MTHSKQASGVEFISAPWMRDFEVSESDPILATHGRSVTAQSRQY